MALTQPAQTAPVSGAAVAHKRPRIYYGYYLIGVALVAQFVSAGTQGYLAGVFLGPMTHDLGWGRGDFTAGQTLSRFVSAFIGFFIGIHVDKGRARTLMLVGNTILGCTLLLTAEVHALWQWILLRGVAFTVGSALIGNLVVNVTLSKWWVENRGRVIGISSMGVSLAGVIMPPLVTPLVDHFGWREGWRILAVMSWLLVYPAALMMRNAPEAYGLHPDGKTDEQMASPGGERIRADFENSLTRGQALRTAALYQIVLAFGFSGIGLGTMLLQTIPFMTDSGFSRGTASLMVTLLALPAAFTKPLWGAYMDYVPEKVAAASSFVICSVAMVLICFGAQAHSLAVLIAGFLFLGAGIGGQIPIQETIWATYFGRRYIGQVRSVALPFSLFLGAGGPQAVSWYFDHVGNYYGAFFALAALWALAAVLVVVVRRPTARLRAVTSVDASLPT